MLIFHKILSYPSSLRSNDDPDVDDRGSKWSLSAFLRHLRTQGVDTAALMRSVEDVVIKAILAAAMQMNTATNMFVPHPRNCFGEGVGMEGWIGKTCLSHVELN